MKYRSRPMVVEAVRYDGTIAGRRLLAAFTGSSFKMLGHPSVRTPYGLMPVAVGDWVLRGKPGKFFACKPDVFVDTFEAIE